MDAESKGHFQLFLTSWIVARQALLSMGFSRQESWDGLPFSSPEDLPDPGIKLSSPALQGDALPLDHLDSPWFIEKTINSPNGDLPQDGF